VKATADRVPDSPAPALDVEALAGEIVDEIVGWVATFRNVVDSPDAAIGLVRSLRSAVETIVTRHLAATRPSEPVQTPPVCGYVTSVCRLCPAPCRLDADHDGDHVPWHTRDCIVGPHSRLAGSTPLNPEPQVKERYAVPRLNGSRDGWVIEDSARPDPEPVQTQPIRADVADEIRQALQEIRNSDEWQETWDACDRIAALLPLAFEPQNGGK
jgi:hypothetical protein